MTRVSLTTYLNKDVTDMVRGTSKRFGISANQYLKALLLREHGHLPHDFFGSAWSPDRRSQYLRGK